MMIALKIQSGTTDNPIRILHLEDSVADHQLACRALTSAGLIFEITRIDSLSNFCKSAKKNQYSVILADYHLAGFTALDAWAAISTYAGRPPFILLSGAIGESAAVSAIHMGISDFIHKDDLGRLARVIQKSLEVAQAHARAAQTAEELAASEKRLAQFATYLQATIERERASIAREIHDDIGGSLAAANLDLSWITRHSTDPGMLSHAKAATEMLQHALGASQRIMMSLRPSILDQGLVPAIQWLAAGFERRTGITTILSTNNDRLAPSKQVELTAYRTTQEALTNISKYAECNRVEIDVSDAGGVLTVEITDNGRGIETPDLNKPSSFGIRGLTERARLVGGWLDVSTTLGTGTSIILSVPLAEMDDSDMKGQTGD